MYSVLFRDEARDEARDELAALWLNADAKCRAQITAASADLDSTLRRSPHDAGESRSETNRVAFFPPRGVLFDVQDADRQVTVLHIWIPKRKN